MKSVRIEVPIKYFNKLNLFVIFYSIVVFLVYFVELIPLKSFTDD